MFRLSYLALPDRVYICINSRAARPVKQLVNIRLAFALQADTNELWPVVVARVIDRSADGWNNSELWLITTIRRGATIKPGSYFWRRASATNTAAGACRRRQLPPSLSRADQTKKYERSSVVADICQRMS